MSDDPTPIISPDRLPPDAWQRRVGARWTLPRIALPGSVAISLGLLWVMAGFVEEGAAQLGQQGGRALTFAAGAGALVVCGLLSWPVERFLLQRWHFAIVDGQRRQVDSYTARPGSLAYLLGGSLAAVLAITGAMLAASGLGGAGGLGVLAGACWVLALAYAALRQWATRSARQRSMSLQ